VAVPADRALASTGNLNEVLTRFLRDGHPAAAVRRQLETYAIEWVAVDDVQAVEVRRFGPERVRPVGRWPIEPAWRLLWTEHCRC
jgi:hypothetical protein